MRTFIAIFIRFSEISAKLHLKNQKHQTGQYQGHFLFFQSQTFVTVKYSYKDLKYKIS